MLAAGFSDNVENLIMATTGIVITFQNIWIIKISKRFDKLEQMIKEIGKNKE